ncbi:MAG: L,D-transpeptidase family protein [Myxococcota bacterium]
MPSGSPSIVARCFALALAGAGLVAAPLAACDKSAPAAQKSESGGGPQHPRGTTAGAPPVVDAVSRGGRGTKPTDPNTIPDGPAAQPDEAPAKVGAGSFASELQRLYGAWSAEEQALLDDAKVRMQAAVADSGGAFAKSIKAIYDKSEGRFVFSKNGELTEDADKLLEILYAVDTHGLKTEPYALDDLKAKVKAFSDASLAAQQAMASQPEGEAALWDFLVKQRQTPVADLASAAEDAGFGDNDLGRLSEARKRLNALLSTRKALNGALADLDVGLVRRLHRWVFDMRFARRAHPFTADKSEQDGIARSDKELTKMVAAAGLGEPGAVEKLAAQVTPQFPDYEPTRVALARYKDLAAKYPKHTELPKETEKLARDMKAPAKQVELVKQLEARLIEEGYLSGEPTGTFGPELEAAVTAYQETHQIKATGKMDKVMRGSLNRSYAERVQILELSLQRYRESDLHQGVFRFGEVPIRARVNIPGFEARFYVGTELGRRHRVVVGNNDTETDAEMQKHGKLNQTRLLTAEMQTIIVNPVWRVPRRIKEQELDNLLMDEPDYYEKHNFKVEVQPDGSELVVQQPGPGNALGLVKFLFPNPFSIYMHDTPSKKLFDRPVRAFSHGCMRTENPVDLARWLLVDQTGMLTSDKFDEVLKSGKETAFQLKKSIPISTDYITTGVDDQGRIVFYADPYGFDRDFFDGKTPYPNDPKLPMTVLF